MELIVMSGAAQAVGAARGVFKVDTGWALEALHVTWGDAYVVCYDDAISLGGARWRLGGDATMISGTTPDELNVAIQADLARGSGT
jgi:hypothetical protein